MTLHLSVLGASRDVWAIRPMSPFSTVASVKHHTMVTDRYVDRSKRNMQIRPGKLGWRRLEICMRRVREWLPETQMFQNYLTLVLASGTSALVMILFTILERIPSWIFLFEPEKPEAISWHYLCVGCTNAKHKKGKCMEHFTGIIDKTKHSPELWPCCLWSGETENYSRERELKMKTHLVASST